jgi:hypothetical protein
MLDNGLGRFPGNDTVLCAAMPDFNEAGVWFSPCPPECVTAEPTFGERGSNGHSSLRQQIRQLGLLQRVS